MSRTTVTVSKNVKVRRQKSIWLRLFYAILSVPVGLCAYPFWMAEHLIIASLLTGFSLALIWEALERYRILR